MSNRYIDKYEIVSTLGRGSMGVVYKGKDPEIGRLVAIKTLKSVFLGEDDAGSEAMKRFRQESRSAGKLHHPNIVTIFEAGRTDDGSPYIVMEYIEGDSLESYVAEHGPLPPTAVIHYLAQMASAIDYAHSQNVIHRDIKPSNIIVDAKHRPQLLDFGVAKLSDTSLTPAGTVVGTPSYMSPEQIRGAKLDGGTDIFSLGVVAFEILCGLRPFPGTDFTTVVSNIIHKEPLTFEEVGTDLDGRLETVLCKALAKERLERYESAFDFVDAMAEVYGVSIDNSGLTGGYDQERSDEAIIKDSARSGAGGYTNGASSMPKAATEVLEVESEEQIDTEPNTAPNTEQNTALEDAATVREVSQISSSGAELDSASGAKRIKFVLLLVILISSVAAFYFFYLKKPLTTSSPPIVTEVTSQTEPPLVKVVVEESKPVEVKSLAVESGIETPEIPENNVKTATPEVPEFERLKSDNLLLALERIDPNNEQFLPLFNEVVRRKEKELTKLAKTKISSLSNDRLLELLSSASVEASALRIGISESAGRKVILFIEPLLALLKHPDYLVRATAVKALGGSETAGDSRVLARITDLLESDSEYIVRGFAAKILGQTRSAEAKTVLENRLALEKSDIVVKMIKKSLRAMER